MGNTPDNDNPNTQTAMEREQALLKCIAELTELVKKQSEILRNPPIIILRNGEEAEITNMWGGMGVDEVKP